MKRRQEPHRFTRPLLAALAAAVVFVSCGSDDSGGSSATDASESTDAASATTASGSTSAGGGAGGDVCASKDALTESVNSLTDIDLSGGVSGVQAAITDVKDDLATLRESASDELRPQVQAVEDALGELETAVGNLGSGGLTDAAAALGDLGTSSQALLESLSERCG